MKSFIFEALYEISKKPYQKYFKKNKPWTITVQELIILPQDSLGFHLYCFLSKHSFELQPKLESHDIYHVLTNIGTTVPEEISMQYYLWGNGKKSLYLFLVISTGTLFYSSHFKTFLKAYKRGKNTLQFFQVDFQKLVHLPLHKIRNAFAIN
ncbi:Coq4 family protein [Cellulophaga sp. L1A9]|uniref:Coq4 family protein n=1 Tax=Cellulophaga sp. L1A9 TaxID=2686362 RepID=UPI00131AFF14|nr:Coq4 family protein [Cellulophaga sp. L1A9]